MERSGEAKSCSLGALQQARARKRGGAANRGGLGVGEPGGPPVVAGSGWVPHAGWSAGRRGGGAGTEATVLAPGAFRVCARRTLQGPQGCRAAPGGREWPCDRRGPWTSPRATGGPADGPETARLPRSHICVQGLPRPKDLGLAAGLRHRFASEMGTPGSPAPSSRRPSAPRPQHHAPRGGGGEGGGNVCRPRDRRWPSAGEHARTASSGAISRGRGPGRVTAQAPAESARACGVGRGGAAGAPAQ